jgi:integrase
MARQRVSEVYLGNIEAAFLKDVLPAIGAMRPDEVTRRDVLDILRKLEGRGSLEMLRRVRMWLRQLYEFGLDAERVQASPVPTGHLKSFMEPQRGHFPALTDPASVGPLLRAIRACNKPIVRFGLLLSAHLWQRPSEIRLAQVEEFDLDGAVWVIPAERMKLRREHWVPLSPQVVAMLRKHIGVVGPRGWLLPGQRHDKPLSDGTLGKALDGMGYAGRMTPHGFRAMARTILEERLEVDARYLEKQLAHEEADKVKRSYNRSEHWAGRVTMMAAWSAWLELQERGA